MQPCLTDFAHVSGHASLENMSDMKSAAEHLVLLHFHKAAHLPFFAKIVRHQQAQAFSSSSPTLHQTGFLHALAQDLLFSQFLTHL